MRSSIDLSLLVVPAADADAEELDLLTRQLRARLVELDLDAVRLPAAGDALPAGAKGGALVAAGALAVSLAGALVPSVLALVEAWLSNRPVRSVRVEHDGRTLELGHATPAQQQLLVAEFLRAVAPGAGDNGPSPHAGSDAGGTAGGQPGREPSADRA